MHISIIIPILNEAEVLVGHLKSLQAARDEGHEVIVVDGGSTDGSQALAKPYADQLLVAKCGRAQQMNAGAGVASGDILLFLHIDTLLPDDGLSEIVQAGTTNANTWGRFDVRLSGNKRFFRVIESMMNWRSRMTGIATGDQAIFVSRNLFHRLHGFADIPLMEDVEISRRLKKIGPPICLTQRVITSSRRWEVGGTLKTIFLMWRLRLAYWLGADPALLVRHYR